MSASLMTSERHKHRLPNGPHHHCTRSGGNPDGQHHHTVGARLKELSQYANGDENSQSGRNLSRENKGPVSNQTSKPPRRGGAIHRIPCRERTNETTQACRRVTEVSPSLAAQLTSTTLSRISAAAGIALPKATLLRIERIRRAVADDEHPWHCGSHDYKCLHQS